jgi:CRP/FNR family transcriptional regulator
MLDATQGAMMSFHTESLTEKSPVLTPTYNRQVVSFQSSRSSAAAPKINCGACHMHELCMPVDLSKEELEQLNALIGVRKRVKRGAALYRAGEEFSALYAIRTGFFKSVVQADDGHEQVTGFQMAAEVMGLDGINTNRYTCNTIALEDSDVCVVPFGQLEELAHAFPTFQRHIHRMMSREIVRDHSTMLLLGSMRADARLAAFLMDLVNRLQSRGYSSQELVLRMTREEIGSYLGLKLETVSRMFSKFVEDGLIEVKQRHIHILSPEKLTAIFSQ